MRRSMTAYWLGRIGYDEAHVLQEKLLRARVAKEIGDTILLLEHDAVITLGRSAKTENILVGDAERAARGVAIADTGRGGDVTFHGPGQLVAYPILDLHPDRLDVRRYVRDLAEVMIRLAAAHGITAGFIPNDSKLVGVWVDEATPTVWDEDRVKEAAIGVPNGCRPGKIGAIGVRLSRWCTMHGFAFNVSTNLDDFRLIVPCGIRELDPTSLERLGVAPPSVETVARASLRHFADVFDADVVLGERAAISAA